MKVTDIIANAKGPLFTFELLPPLKGHTIDAINRTIETLLPLHPAYINITNHQMETIYVERPDGLVERKTTRKRPGTIGLAAAIQYRYGIPVVPHLICGGQTKEQLEDQLVELNFLGIENVLALRGDPPHGERRFVAAKGGYEHTDGMVGQIAAINKGEYLDPTLREPVPASFCVGVAGYPEKHAEAPNLEHDIAMLKRKVDAGAHYIVTQMFFINDRYFEFVDRCRSAGIGVPIIPGIKPIQRKSDLDLLPQTFHVDLPVSLVERMTKCTATADIRKAGVDFCIEQVSHLLAAKVPGVHFYTQGRPEPIAEVVQATYPSRS
ncbi:MAG: methylenetetrahydrofolate reductase [Sphaerochaetaceae bacterium]|jgi:methylenetetrahydrofolate reductase (NADPH)|nr:methylenetetrahydrofolate reductase [Sphaerochaetaceae bacterium]MDX9938826.1 methylenetetrahydrofolate reductase [Sphaerochaetaceae bacterium]